jgi:hypothetical protein
MEIYMAALRAIDVRRRTTMLDKTTLLEIDIHIPNYDIFTWI